MLRNVEPSSALALVQGVTPETADLAEAGIVAGRRDRAKRYARELRRRGTGAYAPGGYTQPFPGGLPYPATPSSRTRAPQA